MAAFTKPTMGRGDASRELKAELGAYIRTLRENRGMTQSDLAKAVGMEYYTGISAIEVGRNVVPPERYLSFSQALGVNPKTFMRRVLQLTNPWAYILLYSDDPARAMEELNGRFPERLGTKQN